MLLVGVAVTGRAWYVSGGLFERDAQRAMTHGSVVLRNTIEKDRPAQMSLQQNEECSWASEAAFLKGEKLRQDKEELTSGRS